MKLKKIKILDLVLLDDLYMLMYGEYVFLDLSISILKVFCNMIFLMYYLRII